MIIGYQNAFHGVFPEIASPLGDGAATGSKIDLIILTGAC
jgi:hypothetical protein